MKKYYFIYSILILLCGCAVGPDFKKPAPKTPNGWYNYNIDINEPAVTWWHKLNDETLNELICRGVFYNWDIKAAQARIKQARALCDRSKSFFWPQINLFGSVTRQHLSQGFPFVVVSSNFNFYTETLKGIWDLDVWGGKRRNLEESESKEKMALEDRRAIMIVVISEIASLYCHIRVIQEQQNLFQKQIILINENIAMLKLLLQEQMISQEEVDNAKAIFHKIEAKIDSLKAIEAKLYMSLSSLTSIWTINLHEIMDCKKPIPNPVDIMPSVGLPSTLLCRRPDVRKAVQKVKAANAAIGEATANFYPRFDFFTTFGNLSSSWLSWFNPSNQNTIWGGALLAPIFNGGLLYANWKEKVAKRDEAMAEYLGTTINAVSQVDAAIAVQEAQKDQFLNLQSIAGKKYKIYQYNYEIFKQDMLSKINLNQSELDYLDVKIKCLESQNDWLNSWITLYKSLGGGWQWDNCSEKCAYEIRNFLK
jgi:NodT family efflux transporter outer membrane factor (OMF) lipoprotein